MLGSGRSHFELAIPEGAPIVETSPLKVFNGGGSGGEVKLLIHAFIATPTPAAVIARVAIERKGSGIHSTVKIPSIAGGSGSVLDFNFTLGGIYAYKSRKVGYIEAKCPDGVFKTNAPKVVFKNDAQVPGVTATTVLKGGLAVPCTPKG